MNGENCNIDDEGSSTVKQSEKSNLFFSNRDELIMTNLECIGTDDNSESKMTKRFIESFQTLYSIEMLNITESLYKCFEVWEHAHLFTVSNLLK